MSWLGAGLGVGIGFAIGGPIGAGIGMWIGSSMGSKNRATQTQQNQTVFFVSLFSMLAKMAKADGVVVKDEINTIYSFMDSIRLDTEDKKAAINIFRNATNDEYTIYQYADQYKEIANKEMREMVYATLWNVASSDGKIHKNENDILEKIPKNLGLNNSVYDEYSSRSSGYAKHSNAADRHYELLGCDRNSSDSDVKKCYRRAMAEYHPDKIQSKGLPKGFIKFANEQSKKINEAYNAIKNERQ